MKFDEWFKKQFGLREHPDAPDDAALRDAVASGEAAARELAKREQWDAEYRAALYAWQIKPEEKP